MADLWTVPQDVPNVVTLSSGHSWTTTKRIYVPLNEPAGNWFIRPCNLGTLLYLVPTSATKTQVKKLIKDAPVKYTRVASGEFYVIDHTINGTYVFAFSQEVQDYLQAQGYTNCDASGRLPSTVHAGRYKKNFGIYRVPNRFAIKLKLATSTTSDYYLKVFP